jgi:glycerophosphoryl diester phosphodiesterase
VAHEAGLEVLAWCPAAHEVADLVAAGVDAVCVNDVPRLLPIVRALAGTRPGPARPRPA